MPHWLSRAPRFIEILFLWTVSARPANTHRHCYRYNEYCTEKHRMKWERGEKNRDKEKKNDSKNKKIALYRGSYKSTESGRGTERLLLRPSFVSPHIFFLSLSLSYFFLHTFFSHFSASIPFLLSIFTPFLLFFFFLIFFSVWNTTYCPKIFNLISTLNQWITIKFTNSLSVMNAVLNNNFNVEKNWHFKIEIEFFVSV